jgi:hypothetical protein
MLTESLTSGSGIHESYPALQRDLSVVAVHHKAQDVIIKAAASRLVMTVKNFIFICK